MIHQHSRLVEAFVRMLKVTNRCAGQNLPFAAAMLVSILGNEPSGHLMGKDLSLSSPVCYVFLRFLSLSQWCPGSGVVLGGIESFPIFAFFLTLRNYSCHNMSEILMQASPACLKVMN